MKVSIDMSKDDETAQNRIFAKVVEEQTSNDGDITLLCDFVGANYDLDNSKKIEELQEKLDVAVKALKFYAMGNHYEDDRAYDYYRILDYGETAQEALEKIKEIK